MTARASAPAVPHRLAYRTRLPPAPRLSDTVALTAPFIGHGSDTDPFIGHGSDTRPLAAPFIGHGSDTAPGCLLDTAPSTVTRFDRARRSPATQPPHHPPPQPPAQPSATHQPSCIECISSSATRSTTHAVAPRLAIAHGEDQIEHAVVRPLDAVARMMAPWWNALRPSGRAVARNHDGPNGDASDHGARCRHVELTRGRRQRGGQWRATSAARRTCSSAP